MKDKKLLMLGTALVTLSSLVAASRAKGATATVSMSAVILQAIALTAGQSLLWGNLTDTGAGGTATVSVAGALGVTGGTTGISGTVQQGTTTVNATTGVPITFSITGGTQVVSGANNMGVDNYQLAINAVTGAAGAALTQSIGASPSTLNIGGRLTVGAAQAAGAYTGTFTVNANY